MELSRFSPEVQAEALAAQQHGVVSRGQIRSLGLSEEVVRRRLSHGRWLELHPGVVTTRAVPPSWLGRLNAARLWAGPQSIVARRSAAGVLGLEGFGPGPVEISVTCGQRRTGVVTLRRSPSDRPTIITVGGMAVTGVERTLLDLAGSRWRHQLGLALDECLRRRLTTLDRLWATWEKDGGKGRRGTAALRAALAARDERSALLDSALEAKMLRILKRIIGPAAVPQYEVERGSRLVARLDFAWPERRVGVETHGFRWHSGRERWERDLARQRTLTLL